MKPFEYIRVDGTEALFAALEGNSNAKMIAGGSNLVDLMKLGVEEPSIVIDINGLPGLDAIETTHVGGLRIGALVTNSQLAWNDDVKSRYPMVSQAILAGATTQIRNMASVGGNLLQKTRCPHYADIRSNCNKRTPGSGCAALEGHNRMCAVLGVSNACIAANPSDLCVTLAALDAKVHLVSKRGSRIVELADFFRLPGDTPEREYDLDEGELITAVELPPVPIAQHSLYKKLRDRTSYAFALVSIGAALSVRDGVVEDVRLAIGGVGTVPWRDRAAEDAMRGAPAVRETFETAADVFFRDAKPQPGNEFKVRLAQRGVVRALAELTETPP